MRAGGELKKSRYEGGCHCGRIRFVVAADLATAAVCNCSICTKKGFIHLIVGPEDFTLVSGREDLTTYEFNTKTAKHHFCRHCGMHPFYIPRSDPNKIDVNVRCLDDIDLEKVHASHFDGKNWEAANTAKVSWR
ncbi:MAG TPA: GFA family protein [Polyangia bacterium]